MTEKLFPYQVTGAEWLSQKRHAILADEMGLGKSAQAIYAADKLCLYDILVLCPAVARRNWQREFEKFGKAHHLSTIIESKRTAFEEHRRVIICSYDLAESIPNDRTFDLIIADEAHYLKSVDTKRTKAVLGKGGLIHRTKRFWALSGTPAPNHPGELWPMLFTFGLYPLAYSTFVKKFCNYYLMKNRIQVTGAKVKAIPELRKILHPAMLRRLKEEVLKDLPPIHYSDVIVEPGLVDIEVESSFVQYTIPPSRKTELIEKLSRERKLLEDAFRGNSMMSSVGIKTMEALAQSVSTLRRFNGLQKVEPVADIVKAELEAGAYEKIVIFCIHRDVIEGLRVKLNSFKPVTLYGGTDPEKRQRNIDKFQRDPKHRVFIGQVHAAGTAITLTAAHQVLFIEQDWVPGNNAQAAMRCHRIGQTKAVSVRFVGIADSIDEKISHVLRRKTAELTRIFDDERTRLTEPVKNPFEGIPLG